MSLCIKLTGMLEVSTSIFHFDLKQQITTDDWVLWATVNDTLSYINSMMRFGNDTIEYKDYMIVRVTKIFLSLIFRNLSGFDCQDIIFVTN